MGYPTYITCTVDNTEYSRYEKDLSTITATVGIQGGAPYVNEPVVVELRKARRGRDAVVATATINFNGTSDPQEALVQFKLPNIVDQDLISLVRAGKYFVRAYHEATSATALVQSAIRLTATAGVDGNDWSIVLVNPGGTSPLSATVVGTTITVNLAVSGGVLIGSQNTAELVANIIGNALSYADGIHVTAISPTTVINTTGTTLFTGGSEEVDGDSADFDIRIVSIERLKKDWLFGLDLTATDVLEIKYQPQDITGITVTKVSKGHKTGFGTLTYSMHANHVSNATASIGSGANGTVTVSSANSLAGSVGNGYTIQTVIPAGTSGLSVSIAGTVITIHLAVIAGVPDNTQNTATLIAAAVDALTDFTAVASGTGASAISTAITSTFAGGVTQNIRSLSWKGGPLKSITSSGTVILQAGTSGPANKITGVQNQDYITVRVASPALMPSSNVTEELLVEAKQMDDQTLGRYLNEAVALIENDLLMIYVEPTNVVTDRDPTSIQFAAGINAPTPIFTDNDFDYLVSPLTYFIPKGTGEWLQIQFPYPQILRVDSLYGAIANTRVIDIDLEWIEVAQQGGLVQLIPFNQEIAFDFVGLIWVNSIRGAVELPNFWHFNAIVGLRDCPSDIQELIGKIAAINALTTASLAFRPGVGSLSLSRDGVSESVSYNSSATYGMFTGAIQSYKDWIEEHKNQLRAKYRGSIMTVV